MIRRKFPGIPVAGAQIGRIRRVRLRFGLRFGDFETTLTLGLSIALGLVAIPLGLIFIALQFAVSRAISAVRRLVSRRLFSRPQQF